MPNTILVVEDEPSTQRLLDMILTSEGFEVRTCDNGSEALGEIERLKPDLVVLDLMMPEMDGFEFSRRVREKRNFDRLPILVLTAKEDTADRYEAFLAGATDFIRKPFDPLELLFRIRSSLRLTGGTPAGTPEVITVGRVRLEPSKYRAQVDEREVILTKLETKILEYLMTHPGQVFSAEHLSGLIASGADGAPARSLDAAHAHIRHLRQKLEPDPKAPTLIVTMGRKGYYFAS